MTFFNTKKAITLISAAAMAVGMTQAVNAGLQNQAESLQQMQVVSSKSFNGTEQWRTMSSGCSYSRAQAPGYAPTWHLIVNPQCMGLPARPKNCKPILQGS